MLGPGALPRGTRRPGGAGGLACLAKPAVAAPAGVPLPGGQVVATPGALAALERAQQAPGEFVARHVSGDWGEVPEEDKRENEFSLLHGTRILSAYRTRPGERLWILTEADRSVTTILLPDEY